MMPAESKENPLLKKGNSDAFFKEKYLTKNRPEAFQKAKREDKPIFLSIGYSACHWCHVMARECFENEETAELLNRGFVSVKVDREERPDVDHVYLDACTLFSGSGG